MTGMTTTVGVPSYRIGSYEGDWSEIDVTKAPGFEPRRPPRRLDDIVFEDELERIWGRKWGSPSKIGRVHTVLVSRPGSAEINQATGDYPEYFLYAGKAGVPGFGVASGPDELPDLALMQAQHDAYVQVLRDCGVEVIYADFPDKMMGAYLPYRGAGYPPALMSRTGCIIGRSALAWKRGQEAIWARKMIEIGVPILYTVNGSGIFEGRVDWLDSRHALLNVGHRANREGFRQMEWILKQDGAEEVLPVELPGNVLTHLDVVFTMVADRLALLYVPGLPYELLKLLESKGIELIEIPGEEVGHIPANAFPVEPGKVIMPAGSPRTRSMLESAGVSVIEVDLSESVKLGAGPDCMTLALIREKGPSLDW